MDGINNNSKIGGHTKADDYGLHSDLIKTKDGYFVENVGNNKVRIDTDDYKEELRGLIENEIESIFDNEIKKAKQEVITEQRRAISQLVEENRAIIRGLVEEHKKAIQDKVAALRKSLLFHFSEDLQKDAQEIGK